MTERHLAEEALDRWRAKVLDNDTRYHERVVEWEKKVEKDAKIARKKAPAATYAIDSYYSSR